MKKSVIYKRTKFTTEVIQKGFETLQNNADVSKRSEVGKQSLRMIELSDAAWEHDSDEEFFSDYIKPIDFGCYVRFGENSYSFTVRFRNHDSTVEIKAPSRIEIERVFQIFESAVPVSVVKEATTERPKETVFIGHGRNTAWRDLKDHLHEKHGYQVEAYEIGSRAGHAIRDVLEEMLNRSNLALLVFTAEDEHIDGTKHARENVIHELGLFQGHLGFHRAIAVVEEGTSEFSNIHGLTQIRFSKGNIRETFGEVLALINREFK